MRKLKDFITNFFKQYRHIWILSYFAIYLVWFNYLEKTVTTHFHVIHVPIDDYIPFCEYFVIPYIMWFGYVAWGITYTALHNKNDFYRLCAEARKIMIARYADSIGRLIIHSVYILRL